MLTDQDRLVLDFEGSRWQTHAAKVTAIWRSFGWTESRYERQLLGLADDPEAEALAPQLIRRVRAMRERLSLERPIIPHA